MLERIIVDNYLLIDHIEFDAHLGMSVFIGETGSGKSLFIESLGIIFGNKFSTNNIGVFRETTKMTAVFSIDEKMTDVKKWFAKNDFFIDDQIIVTRTFQKSGKSTTRLNGEIIPVQTVRSLGEILIDIHSQFDTQQLLKQAKQQEAIDQYIDKQLQSDYTKSYQSYKQLEKQLEIFVKEQQKEHDVDYLYFQRDELASFADFDLEILKSYELEYKSLKQKIQNHQHIEEALVLIGDEGIRQYVSPLEKTLNQMDNLENSVYETFNQLLIQVNELDYALNQLQIDEEITERFTFLEQNIQIIYRLQQKHGDDLASAYSTILDKIEQLENSSKYEEKLLSELKVEEKKARHLAEVLEKERLKIITFVENKMHNLFQKLHLDNIQFRVFREEVSTLTKTGLSTLQFQVASNNQKIFQSLAKTVSGGELSRIMLALKVVMLEKQPMLIVFDEIDSGVSGKVATSIADVLSQLATQHQVFLITHSPLVAVSGNYFYQISKSRRDDGHYETNIQEVNDEKVNITLAYLISQKEPSEAAIEQIQHLRVKYK